MLVYVLKDLKILTPFTESLPGRQTEYRLGNILADIVKGNVRNCLSKKLNEGIQCHHFIDRFTDSHPCVITNKDRIAVKYPRFKSILADIYYDHILAKNWSHYSEISLSSFTSDIYDSFLSYEGELPENAREVIIRMADEDWIGGYETIFGIETTLQKVPKRIKQPHAFVDAVEELKRQYRAFEADFHVFFLN